MRMHTRLPHEQPPSARREDDDDDQNEALKDAKRWNVYPPAPLSSVLELDVKTPEVLLSLDQQDFESDERLPSGPLPAGVPTREEFWQKLPESLKMRFDPDFEKLYWQMTDDEQLAFEQQVAWDYDELAKQYMPAVLELYGIRPPAYKGKPVHAAKRSVYKKLLRRVALLDRGED